jgi:hypothetical protein
LGSTHHSATAEALPPPSPINQSDVSFSDMWKLSVLFGIGCQNKMFIDFTKKWCRHNDDRVIKSSYILGLSLYIISSQARSKVPSTDYQQMEYTVCDS